MTNKELNLKLIKQLPEIKTYYDEEVEWQEGDDTGAHVVYGDVLKPYLLENLILKNRDEVQRIINFLEEILKINDNFADEVIAFSVLESIITEEIDMQFMESLLGKLSGKIWEELKEYYRI